MIGEPDAARALLGSFGRGRRAKRTGDQALTLDAIGNPDLDRPGTQGEGRMSGIFLSYASEDRERIRPLVAAPMDSTVRWREFREPIAGAWLRYGVLGGSPETDCSGRASLASTFISMPGRASS